MRKLLILSFLIFSTLAYAQPDTIKVVGQDPNNRGGDSKKVMQQKANQWNTYHQAGIDSLQTGVFNVLNYGASAATGSDVAAIQTAIDLAEAQTNGGTVIIPAIEGNYTIDDTIFLRSDVHIEVAPSALLFAPSSYTGPMLYANWDLKDCWVTGGSWYSNSWDNDCVFLDGDGSHSIYRNHFKNMLISQANRGIYFYADNGGYVNGNIVDDTWLWNCRIGIKTKEGAGSTGVDGNMFDNISIQENDSTIIGLDSISGNRNQFTNINFWDFNAGDYLYVFDVNSDLTYLQGAYHGNGASFSDLGEDNRAVFGNREYSNLNIDNSYGDYTSKVQLHARARITFSQNGVADTIVYLASGSVIDNIIVRTSEAFDDSGSDLFDVGISTNGDRFIDGLDIAAAAMKDPTLLDNPYYSVGRYITATYIGENSDATTGIVDVFIYYTPSHNVTVY